MPLTTNRAAQDASPNLGFVNRARDFANRAVLLPGVPILPAICLAVAIVAVLSGAFETGVLPVGQRTAFWLCLMSFECAKWLAWLAWRVRVPQDYWRAALIGTPLLALSLPFEIWLSYRIVGVEPTLVIGPTLLAAFPVGLAILGVMALVHPPLRGEKNDLGRMSQRPGAIERAGFTVTNVIAVQSEDHYCRLFLREGETALIAARLTDLISDLNAVDGMQIHRSHWVADEGVKSARRVGRGWAVSLPCGTELRVSEKYRAEAKRRGWLSRGNNKP